VISPKVLLVSAADHDRAYLEELQSLLSTHVPLTCVREGKPLERLLEGGCYDALFYLRPAGREDWKEPLRKIRARLPDLPVIVLSETEMIGEFAEVLQSGAFDFLLPPYASHTLLAAVTQAVASTEGRARHAVRG